MMVTFVSQCEKKALNRTRRVLDAFADRIGDNTWQTVITQEGLLAVRKLLRKTASKNSAVSCHWIRSRSRSELVWIVGNKNKFNDKGVVPVNTTVVNRAYEDSKADWHYLPVIQALSSMAALLHDWGKASARFQQKLSSDYRGQQGDALRHEWISCLLLQAFISNTDSGTDIGWLSLLEKGEINEAKLQNTKISTIRHPLNDLPPVAKFIAWLILAHHRLPLQKGSPGELLNRWNGEAAESIDRLFVFIDCQWGYENDAAKETLGDCLRFPKGLVCNSKPWLKELKRWAKKLLDQQALIEKIMGEGSYRPVLHHARLCLMLGDHFYSSLTLKESGAWRGKTGLIANTQKNRSPKQALDQHLLGVCKQAKRNVHRLPLLESHLPISENIRQLRKKSPPPYAWQDKAAGKIRDWVKKCDGSKCGFFAVNMASTGCGKTFANAKAMLALSEEQDGLRFILALGLRTLTLQTGDEYRERIFTTGDGSDLAVLIGSKAVTELHCQPNAQPTAEGSNYQGSESQQSLLGEGDEVIYDGDIPEQGMATLLQSDRDRAFLYAPVLACTIDHIMAATETTRGGRYILPSLRLLSSDLVIDEIDDFTDGDLIAIGRLVHLAGMLGRKVMISSATIPPALAEGYFNCYREGWRLFAQTRTANPAIGCAWIDEYNTVVSNNKQRQSAEANACYAAAHNSFIEKRIVNLEKEPPKRKAEIIDCSVVMELPKGQSDDSESDRQSAYFDCIARDALIKHSFHHQMDTQTGLSVSFGVVRVANIAPCVALARFLLNFQWPLDTEVRVMGYHSQQVLLLRHAQEKHLDAVLKRKEAPGMEPVAFTNAVIRNHLDFIHGHDEGTRQVLFILVATPVEEVGRDHDFDWAIVEPSSYRSIIQLAGRVKRHRSGETHAVNVGILQYNWRTINKGESSKSPRFYWPGYESGRTAPNGKSLRFKNHDLSQLLDVQQIGQRLDAIPRIQEAGNTPRFAKLEHAVISSQLKHYDGVGPETMQGYISQHWYLSGLPQALNRFRQSRASIPLFRCFDSSGKHYFTEKNDRGQPVFDIYEDLLNQDDLYGIEWIDIPAEESQRLWLYRDYTKLLEVQVEVQNIDQNRAALRYGEVVIQEYGEKLPKYSYSDQFGLFQS